MPSGVNPINIEIDVVTEEVPDLLGLDAMDNLSLTPFTATNKLIERIKLSGDHVKTKFVWHIPVKRALSQHL